MSILFFKIIKNTIIHSIIVWEISYTHNDDLTYTHWGSGLTITSYIGYKKYEFRVLKSMTSVVKDNNSLQAFFDECIWGIVIISFNCCVWSSVQHSLQGKMIKHCDSVDGQYHVSFRLILWIRQNCCCTRHVQFYLNLKFYFDCDLESLKSQYLFHPSCQSLWWL